MDHQEIEERNIPDLYLMNKLPTETRMRFEEHFVSCPECQNRLEVTEGLRKALKSDLIGRSLKTVQSERHGAFFRTYVFAFGAAVLLIGFGLAATFAFRMWSEQRRQSEGLRTRLAEVTASLEQEKNKTAQLNDQIAAIGKQQIPVPVFPLVITRGTPDAGKSSINNIVLSQAQNWVILLLELPDVPGIETYRAVVRDSSGTLVSDISGLKSTSRDNLAVSFVSSLFMKGDYTIALEGLDSGRYIPLGKYSFHVLR